MNYIKSVGVTLGLFYTFLDNRHVHYNDTLYVLNKHVRFKTIPHTAYVLTHYLHNEIYYIQKRMNAFARFYNYMHVSKNGKS